MFRSLQLIIALFFLHQPVGRSQTIPSPKDHFGFNIGDDYQLSNYTQTEAYFKKLAVASDRIKLVDIGLTAEGRHQYMLIGTSLQNQKKLACYKEISDFFMMNMKETQNMGRQLFVEWIL